MSEHIFSKFEVDYGVNGETPDDPKDDDQWVFLSLHDDEVLATQAIIEHEKCFPGLTYRIYEHKFYDQPWWPMHWNHRGPPSEPTLEIDLADMIEDTKCPKCKNTGWLEPIEGEDGSYITSRPCKCEIGAIVSRLKGF